MPQDQSRLPRPENDPRRGLREPRGRRRVARAEGGRNVVSAEEPARVAGGQWRVNCPRAARFHFPAGAIIFRFNVKGGRLLLMARVRNSPNLRSSSSLKKEAVRAGTRP